VARGIWTEERAALRTWWTTRVLDSSADDAPGVQHGDALESAAVRLEAGHPGLAGAIRSVLDALAKAGI
jgi:hypothetical protein